MKSISRIITFISMVLVMAACSSPAPSTNIISIPASSTTQTKTGITTWKISGEGVNVSARGEDANSKVIHSLSSVKNSDGSIKAAFIFRSAAVAETSRSFTLKSGAEPVGIPIADIDESLCPGCMGDDLKVSAATISLEPLQTVTAECRAARRALTAALTEVMNTCRRTPIAPVIDQNACFQAQLEVISAQLAVQEACGS